MGFAAILFTAFGLAMDAFAVSLGVGTTPRGRNPRAVFRISFHSGLFQGLMTLVGWLAGSTISRWIESWDHWLVLLLLGWVGLRMVREGLSNDEEEKKDVTRGGTMVMVCIACSLDAMAVGLSMAMLKVDVVLASAVIALVALGMSLLGCLIGGGLGNRFGKKMEVVGGVILTLIGVRVLLSHLLV